MATDNFVKVSVRALDEAKPDLTELKARLEELQGKVAQARADVDTKDGDAKLLALESQLDAVSKRIASPRIDMAGASRALAQVAAVDVALDALGDKAPEHARTAGEKTGDSFAKGFTDYVKPPMSLSALITGGVLSGLAALPALTAAGGAVAGTAFAAKFLIGTKKAQGPLYSQAQDLMKTVTGVMQDAVSPMIAPLKSAFSQLGSFMQQIGPLIKSVFSAIAPMIQPLVYGLEGLVGGVLPGFISLMKAAQPAVQALAGLLADLGDSLGQMFTAFAPAVTASASVLKMLGDLLSGLLPVIGQLGASLAGSLAPVIKAFGDALTAVMPAIVTVGKILGSLAGAILTSLSGALQAVASVVQAAAPGFTALAGALSQVFTALENTGAFGALEDAIENIAKPLGQFVNGVLKAAAPVISQVAQLAGQLGAALAGPLGNAIAQILPPLEKLAVMVLGALGKVLGQLVGPVSQFFSAITSAISGGLVTVVDALLKLATQALGPLLSALPGLVPPITKFFEAFTKGNVESAITKIIGALVKIVTSVIGPLGTVLPAVVPLVGALLSAFTPVVATAVGDIATALAAIVTAIPPGVIQALAIGFVAIAGGIKLWAIAQGILDLALSANPIGLLVIAIAGLVIGIVELVKHWHDVASAFDKVRHEVAKIADGLRHDVAAVFDKIRHDIASWASWLPNEIRHAWDLVWSQTVSGLDNIRHGIASKFDQVRHDIASWGDDVIHWFEGLPGRIMSGLGNLGTLLYNAGKSAISMLINGLKSIPVVGTMISIGQDIVDHLPHSPAKKGPLSGSGSPDVAGRKIVSMLASGIASGAPEVQAVMQRVTGTVQARMSGAAAGGAGGSGGAVTVTHQLEFSNTSGDLFLRWLRQTIRTKGGNVQAVLGAA
jgi:phage-related protein